MIPNKFAKQVSVTLILISFLWQQLLWAGSGTFYSLRPRPSLERGGAEAELLQEADKHFAEGRFPKALHKYYAAVWEHRNQAPDKELLARRGYMAAWRRLAQLHNPSAFVGKFEKFTHCERDSFRDEIMPVITSILGQERLSDGQTAELERFLKALKAIEDTKKKFQRTPRWPRECHVYAKALVDILKNAGVKNVRYRERENPISPYPLEIYKDMVDGANGFNFVVTYHAFVVCEVAGIDFFVDISADLFDVVDIVYFDGINFMRSIRDLGVVAIPQRLVEVSPENRRSLWFYTSGSLRKTHFVGDYELGDHFCDYIASSKNPYRAVKPIPAEIDMAARRVISGERELPQAAYWLLVRYALGNLTRAEAAMQLSDLFGIKRERAAECVLSIPRPFVSPREGRGELECAQAIQMAI